MGHNTVSDDEGKPHVSRLMTSISQVGLNQTTKCVYEQPALRYISQQPHSEKGCPHQWAQSHTCASATANWRMPMTVQVHHPDWNESSNHSRGQNDPRMYQWCLAVVLLISWETPRCTGKLHQPPEDKMSIRPKSQWPDHISYLVLSNLRRMPAWSQNPCRTGGQRP